MNQTDDVGFEGSSAPSIGWNPSIFFHFWNIFVEVCIHLYQSAIKSADMSPHWKIHYFHLKPPPKLKLLSFLLQWIRTRNIFKFMLLLLHILSSSTPNRDYGYLCRFTWPGRLLASQLMLVLVPSSQFCNRGPIEYIYWMDMIIKS